MSCSGTDSQMSYRCTRMDEALLVIAHAAGYRWGGWGLFVRKYGWLNRSAWSVFAEPATLFRQGQAHTWRLEFYQRHIYHDFTSAPQWQIGQEFLWSPSCSKDESCFFLFLNTKKTHYTRYNGHRHFKNEFWNVCPLPGFRTFFTSDVSFFIDVEQTDKTASLTQKIPFYCREDWCWGESHWKTGDIMKIPLCGLQ